MSIIFKDKNGNVLYSPKRYIATDSQVKQQLESLNNEGKLSVSSDIDYFSVEGVNLINPRVMKYSSSSSVNLVMSGKIPVKKGDTVYINNLVQYYKIYTDENDAYFNTFRDVTYDNRFNKIKITDENAKYFEFRIKENTTDLSYADGWMVSKEPIEKFISKDVKSLDLTENYKEYFIKNIINNDFALKELIKILGNEMKPLKGLKIAIIGDSNTNWNGTSQFANGVTTATYNHGFGTLIAEQEGCEFVNLGTAGASWELTTIDGTDVTSEPDTDKYSAVRRVDSIVNNNTKYDVILFFMGTNRKNLGSESDTYENPYSMCGAIHYCLKKLIEKYPTLPIGIILPPQRAEGYDTQKQANNLMKSIANYYSIPTLDLFNEGGVTLNSHANAGQIGDGLHFAQNGVIHIAKRIVGFIKSFAQFIRVPFKAFDITGDNTVSVGSNVQLTIIPRQTLYPTDSIECVWSSSDTTKAIVDDTGLVTGVASGSVTITAISIIDSTVKNTYSITVS